MLMRLVAPELGDIGRAVAWADGVLADAGVPADARADIQVCVEEALANLVLHAPDPPEHKDIRVRAGVEGGAPRVEIHDRCRPFDPVTSPLPPRADLAGTSIGGAGLRLMRALASELRYESGEGGNTLVMRFEPCAAEATRPLPPPER